MTSAASYGYEAAIHRRRTLAVFVVTPAGDGAVFAEATRM